MDCSSQLKGRQQSQQLGGLSPPVAIGTSSGAIRGWGWLLTRVVADSGGRHSLTFGCGSSTIQDYREPGHARILRHGSGELLPVPRCHASRIVTVHVAYTAAGPLELGGRRLDQWRHGPAQRLHHLGVQQLRREGREGELVAGGLGGAPGGQQAGSCWAHGGNAAPRSSPRCRAHFRACALLCAVTALHQGPPPAPCPHPPAARPSRPAARPAAARSPPRT